MPIEKIHYETDPVDFLAEIKLNRAKLNEIIDVVNRLEKYLATNGLPPGVERDLTTEKGK